MSSEVESGVKRYSSLEKELISCDGTTRKDTKSDFSDISDVDSDFIDCLTQCKFESVLNHEVSGNILLKNTENRDRLDLLLQDNIPKFLDNENKILRELQLLGIAVSCLQTFVQDNWIGPVNKDDSFDWLSPNIKEKRKDASFKSSIESDLYMDGEEIYSKCRGIEYLYIARIILLEYRESITHLKTWSWWLLRCLGVHQSILDDKSPTLKTTVIQLIDLLSKTEPFLTDEINNRDLMIQFNLEAGYLCYTFYEYKRAKEHFKTATKVAGLSVELTGVMGKRTRFQQESKSQLVLKVDRQTDITVDTTAPSLLPTILSLDDDTVMEQISFDEGDIPQIKLSGVEQALVIGMMENHRRSQAEYDRITEEECMAYIDYVLSQVKCWCVCVSALFRRCILQRDRRRTVERSMMQLEELVNQTKRQDPPCCERLNLFYSTAVSPLWIVQKHLGELFLSLGAIGSALDVFERLELWEDAIKCYQRLGKMEKAETVIREQLQIKETPNMWCFLGDVTRDKQHYEKAWEMSNHRNARSQRCLGYIYFGEENYEKSLECFEASLGVNSLQPKVCPDYYSVMHDQKWMKLDIKLEHHLKMCILIFFFSKWPPLSWKQKKGGKIESAQNWMKLYRNNG